jgi:hypothetical protein
MIRRLPLAFALAVAGAAAASAQDTYSYDAVFANAATTSFEAQIAGTYPARNEILVKLANRNQFAVPVDPDSDLSMWRRNDVVEVSMAVGQVVGLSNAKTRETSYSYEVVTDTGVMQGVPDDSVVRKVTLVTSLKNIDPAGFVTFVAPSGEEQTAMLQDIGLIEGYNRGGAGLVELTYFDDIDVRRR